MNHDLVHKSAEILVKLLQNQNCDNSAYRNNIMNSSILGTTYNHETWSRSSWRQKKFDDVLFFSQWRHWHTLPENNTYDKNSTFLMINSLHIANKLTTTRITQKKYSAILRKITILQGKYADVSKSARVWQTNIRTKC